MSGPWRIPDPVAAPEPRPATPEQAWAALEAGNLRFVDGLSLHPHQDALRRRDLREGQQPMAIIFGCSDSRLAAEIIFDVGLGDVFVVRTAGQVVDDAVLGTLEYGVAELHIPLIVVLGHSACGAVTAACESVDRGTMPGGHIRGLVERITTSVLAARRAGGTSVNDASRENVRQTARNLADRSSILGQAAAAGSVAVVAAYYRLDDGKVELLESV